MISNERPSPAGYRSDRRHVPQQPYRPPSQDEVLASVEFPAEKKVFKVSRRRNAGGELVRVMETRGEKMSMVLVPLEGVPDLIKALQDVTK